MSQPTRAAMFNMATEAPIYPTSRHYSRTFADDAARNAAVPDMVGQYGFQLDNSTIYRSDGTSAGEWASILSLETLTVTNGLNVTGTTQIKGVRTAVVSKTANYTATANDRTIKVDSTGGAFDIDLPDATTCNGLILSIIKIDASGNSVTVDPHSTQHMSGQSSIALDVQWDCLTIQSDGANWMILSFIDQV